MTSKGSRVSSMAFQTEENSKKKQCPNLALKHKILSSFLTDLIFRKNYRRRTALLD